MGSPPCAALGASSKIQTPHGPVHDLGGRCTAEAACVCLSEPKAGVVGCGVILQLSLSLVWDIG